jgi:hypothetical protein
MSTKTCSTPPIPCGPGKKAPTSRQQACWAEAWAGVGQVEVVAEENAMGSAGTPGDLRGLSEDRFPVGRKCDDVLDGLDDGLHGSDVFAGDEYRVLGEEVGVRRLQAGVETRHPEAGLQRPLQLLLIDRYALAAPV